MIQPGSHRAIITENITEMIGSNTLSSYNLKTEPHGSSGYAGKTLTDGESVSQERIAQRENMEHTSKSAGPGKSTISA